MNIKTLSQITPLDGDINISAYLGVSQYDASNGGRYCSRKVPYKKLRDQLTSYVDAALLRDKYHALAGGVAINVNQLRLDVNALSSSSVTLGGVKTFSSTPRITATVDVNNQNNVPNVKCVESMIADRAGFMTENQYVQVDPKNGSGYTYFDEHRESPEQMYWHIDHNQTDSSKWKDEFGAEAGPAVCKYTGNLVCYGWLADNGNVKPGNAWVGIFGNVKSGSSSASTWAALQIQPWIIGKYSSVAQYVSFNIPVKKGLRLKIMTGFQVNGNNTGLHGDRPTLMFADAGNMPNTFVGYILRAFR